MTHAGIEKPGPRVQRTAGQKQPRGLFLGRGRDEFLPYGLNRKKDMAVSCGPGMPGPLQDAQFFSGIFGWLYSIFHKYEQNMSLPS